MKAKKTNIDSFFNKNNDFEQIRKTLNGSYDDPRKENWNYYSNWKYKHEVFSIGGIMNLIEYVTENLGEYKQHGEEINLKECPFCRKK